jgi:hypothetical protein
MAEPTLEEMAQALERGRQQLAEAEAEAERLKRPYHAALAHLADVRKAVELIELGMETAKRAHLIERAIEEAAGAPIDAPPVVMVQTTFSVDRFELVAVGPEGTPLYLHTPKRSHRYHGKSYAVAAVEGREKPSRDAHTSKAMEEAGLMSWQERGKGQWGDGSGSIKPVAPPEGGKWRWLKVREQELLEPETAA